MNKVSTFKARCQRKNDKMTKKNCQYKGMWRYKGNKKKSPQSYQKIRTRERMIQTYGFACQKEDACQHQIT